MKNTSTSKITVNQLAIRDPPTGGVFSTFDDFWVNTKYFFVKKSPSINQTFYCRSLRYSYKNRHEAGRPGPYDKSDFDRAFSRMVIGKSPYHLKDKFSSLPLTEMNRVVRAAFHPYSEISARWPEPKERIYDRLVGGYIGVWLEHLRSGWNPRCHQFVKHLFKYVYKISTMQVTPNMVKWITWFLACYNQMDYQPTFRLFHQLFYLVRSNHLSLYELRFRAVEYGYDPGSAKPVIHQSSSKHWDGELIFLKGLD